MSLANIFPSNYQERRKCRYGREDIVEIFVEKGIVDQIVIRDRRQLIVQPGGVIRAY